MKRIKYFYTTTFLILFLSISFNSNAQVATKQKKNTIELKKDLVLTYSATDPDGNEVSFPISIIKMEKDAGLTLKYEMTNGKKTFSGLWIISEEGLENGEYLNWQPLNPGEVRKVPKNQTIFCVSRKFFDEIQENKTANYDEKVFELKELPKGKEIVINNKIVDVLYVKEKDGDLAFWILNNREIPFIINTEGNQYGPSFTLSKIE